MKIGTGHLSLFSKFGKEKVALRTGVEEIRLEESEAGSPSDTRRIIRVMESEPGTYIPACAKSVPAKAGALFLPKAADKKEK